MRTGFFVPSRKLKGKGRSRVENLTVLDLNQYIGREKKEYTTYQPTKHIGLRYITFLAMEGQYTRQYCIWSKVPLIVEYNTLRFNSWSRLSCEILDKSIIPILQMKKLKLKEVNHT